MFILDFLNLLTESYSLQELVLIITILILLVILILLFTYTLYLRLRYFLKDKYIEKKKREWENIILEVISAETDTTSIVLNKSVILEDYIPYDMVNHTNIIDLKVKYKDFQIFGEFVEEYLVNLEGEDYNHIIQLMSETGYGEVLMKAIDKSDKWGKAYAAHFLGLMNYKKAEEKLLKLVYDKSPVVYLNAFEALNKIESREKISQIIKNLLKNKFIGNTKVIEILLGYGNSINTVLIEMLEDAEIDSEGKRLIVDILASRGVFESVEPILELAKIATDLELEIGCIKAFGLLEDPVCVPFLMERLYSGNAIIRSQSAKSLGKIGMDDAIPVLEERLFKDNDYWMKLYSALALKEMKEKGMDVLKRALEKDSDEQLVQIVNHILEEEVNL